MKFFWKKIGHPAMFNGAFKRQETCPFSWLNFSNLIAIFLENWPNNMVEPPLRLVPPRMRNPGSATNVCNRNHCVIITKNLSRKFSNIHF